MLNIGRAGEVFEIQQSTTAEDSHGAPYSTWSTYANVYAEIENQQTSSDTANNNGHNAINTTMTLVIRCHPSQLFVPSMRAIQQENMITYDVVAVRYDYRRTTAFLDCSGGLSSGGVS